MTVYTFQGKTVTDGWGVRTFVTNKDNGYVFIQMIDEDNGRIVSALLKKSDIAALFGSYIEEIKK